jgi:hypothetical protein
LEGERCDQLSALLNDFWCDTLRKLAQRLYCLVDELPESEPWSDDTLYNHELEAIVAFSDQELSQIAEAIQGAD